jgi:PAS domain S-box-containing protein
MVRRAAMALEAAGVGEFEWDLVGDELTISPRMAAITGLAEGTAPGRRGQALYDHVHPADLAALRESVSGRLVRSGRSELRFRLIRPDGGPEVWLSGAAVASKTESGELETVVGVVRDITAEKGEADQREGLVAELDHRVKNVLASVHSMAAQSARRTASLEVFLKTFFGRLEAMASAHTLLTATRWRGAEIGQIAAAELGGLALGQARWSGPEIVLNPRATHALTLALHELAANAVKFGALSIDQGRVDVAWRETPAGGVELVWIEQNGPGVAPPVRRGFGRTLLERVTGRELGGAAVLDFRPGGLRAVLTAGPAAMAGARAAEPPIIPMASPPLPDPSAAGTSRGGPEAPDIRGVRVLIVEDAVLLALELESGLTEAGARVVGTAADLDEAAAMLGLTFDAAVLDANLNGRSVTPVAEALAARAIPFIFATGYGDAGAAPAGFDAPVVRKPYNIHQIAVGLTEALARRRVAAP